MITCYNRNRNSRKKNQAHFTHSYQAQFLRSQWAHVAVGAPVMQRDSGQVVEVHVQVVGHLMNNGSVDVELWTEDMQTKIVRMDKEGIDLIGRDAQVVFIELPNMYTQE